MLSDKQMKAFNDFYESASHNDVLDPRTTLLLHLSAAMAVACVP